MPEPILCVHGGAGALRRDGLPAELERGMRDALAAALTAGRRILRDGGPALDAVVAAVASLEMAEDFNAGRGSVLTSAGGVEMDASVMRGRDRAVGAVACVRRIVHPVEASRRLLDEGRHVLLAGPEADAWAERAGLPMQDPTWFVTERRRRQLAEAKAPTLDHDADTTGSALESNAEGTSNDPPTSDGPPELGTVGAVARDVHGGLSAATSTGGLTGQAPGRVGDSPIPGAGTWADDRSCAVSATGEGERILRVAMAAQVDAWMRIAGLTLEEACRRALAEVESIGGRAGLIAVDREGRVALPFVTEGMARGVVRGDAEPRVALFGDEKLGDEELREPGR